MSVYKRGKGTHWHYYFRVRGVRYEPLMIVGWAVASFCGGCLPPRSCP